MAWRRWVPMAAVVAAISVLVTGALVWPGLDAQQASRTDALVWILQTGSGQRYARVNTDLAELDTVRQVKNATTVAQTGQNAYIVADGAARVAQIDQSQPKDLTADTLAQTPATPAGTVQVAQAGNFIAFRASSGTVQFGQLDAMTALGQLRTDSRADAAPLVSLAIAVNADGVLTAYSATEQRVVRYDIAANRELSSTSINGGPTDAGVQITGSGDHWLVLSGDGKRCWVSGQNDPVNLETTGTTVVQRATVGGDGFAVADSLGLYNVDFAGRATRTYQPGSSLGTPAAPVISGNELLAAWLPKTGSGSLWRSSGAVSLDYAGASLDEDAAPQFMFTGDRAVLNDTKSGWAWTMPDGKLVPSSQDWKLVDQQQEKSTEEGSPVETSEQKPPVAVADSFGVRAGALVNLPVLLNDYDPNPDVLTIDPTVRDSDLGSFGSLVVTDNNQRLAVQVAAGATGSVSFSYRVSDGTADDGRYSNTARVQLSVESGNSAPECDSICQAQWPSPEVAAGGTIKVPILNAWVDPEGDQLLVSGATSDSESVSVAADPEGYVVVQSHGSTAEQTVGVEVQVSDALGATATKHLDVKVTSAPKISAESFAATAVVGQPATIDVGPYVLGTIGKLSISDVRTTGDGKATFGSGGTSFTFQSPSTGVRLLTYTVTDGTTKATAQVRVTISDAASSRFATPAVVAFVRPNEDATVDVLKAVDNPTGRVLLVSEASAEPAKDASLSVDIVGQQYLRVTGTTGSGAAGKLGVVKYLISDGQEGTAEGQATIYLLPPAQQVAPIAVDDVVTVRAGAQLDIPVTSNDIAAMGSSLRVDPRTVSVTDQNALAFASGNVIRTLAPSAPGHYQISYGVYSSGNPRLVSDATVKVTVLANTDNRAPAPQTLSGRVFSGQSTTIGFDDFGIDPDGDAVRLQRILTQPATGSAAISADGTGIVYTSAPGAAGGQVEFTYQVVDSYGATGVGVVRVGVLNQQASPAPITYTDYADVQVGAQNKVRISPLANDIDPNGGALTITAVRPNAEEKLSDGSSNPEYQRLAAQIEESSGPVVVIKAGDAAGTLSFRYDVRSDSGNTASGLIVVRVVAEEVPNYPEVADTVLTAETREQFPTGVDVVTNKATWAGGDATRLQLSLWSGDKGSYATAVAANGWSLSGELPDNSRIIPFQVTATAADGSPLKTADGKVVSTYAFLHVPGRNDMQLTLRSDVTAQVVNENQSVSFDMDALVAKPSGSKLEIGDGVAASKARLQGSCRLVSGTTVEYSAGNGSPWADSCIVPVRLAGQADFTYLAVPIKVNPGAPQPVLKPGSVTVSPGETKTYDLAQMTSWDGASDQASVQYSLGSAVADFDVSLNGQQLTIVGKDSAVSGRDDKLMISITSHQGVQPAALNLRVGPVPSQLPAGASVSTSCSQASGSNCVVPVTGVNGETNPFPNSPLKLVSVAATGGCSQVSFSVASDSAVGVRWNAGASGGTCTASFVVKDAQGRTSAGGRNGTLTVELLGYPEAPDSVYQSAYTGDSVTLRVRPGAARSAHPAVTGFVVRQGGAKVADCDADGACPSISAPLGEARTYEVTSKNSVGESKTSVQVSAWAYTAPPAPADVTAEPIVTDGDGDLVQLTISGIDTSQTGSLRITSAAGNKETVAVSGPTMTTRFDVGSNEATKVTVTPVSLYQNPPDLEGSTTGESKSVMTNGIGQPTGLSLSVKATVLNDTTTQLTATGSAKQNGDGSEVRYGFSINGGCAAQDADTTGTFDVEAGKTYEVTMCAASYYNNTNYGASSVTKSANAVQDPAAPTGYTFVVNSKSTGSDANPQWVVTAKPTSSESPPTNNVAVFSVPDGWGQAGYADKYKVRYCHKDWGQCGDWGSVQARSGSAPYQVQAELSVTKCVVGTQPTLYQGSTSGDATITVEYGNATYTVDGNTVGDTNNKVPDGATAISIPVKLAWPASWGLTSRTSTITGSCSS